MDAVGTKRRGRNSRKKSRLTTKIEMLPQLTRGLPLTEPMSEEQILKIDDASMSILEEIGVDFRDPIALQQWKEAGADVQGERVRFDRDMIRELISSIPENITLHARNPENTVTLGGKQSIFVPMTGAPFISDLENKRRWPTLEDLGNLHKLSHMSPAIHSSAHHIVEPMDHAVSHRHLRITYSSMKYSDKTFSNSQLEKTER
uniref:Methyltransferase n=1 Tax=uncultured Thiotrichaceae bacterium TaxID=298394 RepID=A0A6S6UGG8_9GAMM|nr:MAG: Methyltransferase [uncultured Thiotrichaceae bacterium]